MASEKSKYRDVPLKPGKYRIVASKQAKAGDFTAGVVVKRKGYPRPAPLS